MTGRRVQTARDYDAAADRELIFRVVKLLEREFKRESADRLLSPTRLREYPDVIAKLKRIAGRL